MISFFLDESALCIALRDTEAGDSIVENLVEAMESVNGSHGCYLYIPTDIYGIDVNGESFAQAVFASDSTNRDLILRLQLAIDGAHERDVINCQAAYGATALSREGAGGLISNVSFYHSTWWISETMVGISSASEFQGALRKLFLAFRIPDSEFENFLPGMFPNVYFHDIPSAKKLGKQYVEVIHDLVAHLGWLNDNAVRIFGAQLNDAMTIAGASGILMSPESSNTHRDKQAMAQRTVNINGEAVCCEWHTKFDKTKGRVHFNAFVNGRNEKVSAVTGNKVIIGVVAEHLK